MHWKPAHVLILFVIVSVVAGCAESNPATPPPVFNNTINSCQSANRSVFAFGSIVVSEDRSSVEIVPMRSGEMHLNVLRLIEVTACSTCLEVENFYVTSSDVLHFDLTLSHPYPGLNHLTGFDVRAILMTGGDYEFPVSGRTISWGDNIRLLYPDGYTTLFNPTEFPEDQPGPPALRYIPGNYATGGDLSSTLNPFVAFGKSMERRMFSTTGSETASLSLELVPGPIEVGYAVDACWAPVTPPVTDPLTEFPPEANCREAYRIFMTQGPGLRGVAGTSAWFQVEVDDHQGVETVSTVLLEAPDLFDETVSMPVSSYTDEGVIYRADIYNDKGADEGVYPLVVRVIDWDADENLGQVDAWHVAEIKVTEHGYPLNGLVYIPEGWFYMGADPDDPDGDALDTPGHMHPTGEYWIGRYEVTYEELASFVAAGGYTNQLWWSEEGWEWHELWDVEEPSNWSGYLKGLRNPAWPVAVNYYEAEAFCIWVGGRLPTEAEWERAARGDGDHRIYPWGDVFDPLIVAWHDNPLIPFNRPMPVGSFSPEGDSPWGLSDCSGNILEWTTTWGTNVKEIYEQYESGDFTPPPPPDAGDPMVKIHRGGHRTEDPWTFRCAHRRYSGIDDAHGVGIAGFRIAF